MDVYSYIVDKRIGACNVLIELSTTEYLAIAEEIVDKNEFQRRKVISSRLKTTLKKDIKKLCTIPPIVLGVRESEMPDSFDYLTFKDEIQVRKWFDEKAFIVLDGLQRTHVLMELKEEDPTGEWLQQKLRCEVYVGLEKLGVLYRMLTLNTGQTTMSTRHLLEILYHDYLGMEIEGVKLVRDKDNENIDSAQGQYSFRDLLDGYASYLNGREVPIERADILQNVETLDRLERSDYEKEGYAQFVKLFHLMVVLFNKRIAFSFKEEAIKATEYTIESSPFGKDIFDIFVRSQSMTGFGAAMSFLKDRRGLELDATLLLLKTVDFSEGTNAMNRLILSIDFIKTKSNKVGNDQRFFFRELYTSLLDREKDSYLNFYEAVKRAEYRIHERIEPDSR